MTSLATVFGLLPMAIGFGTGGETNAPLARAVVGGLSVSTLLTLFLVPTMYMILEERFPRQLREEQAEPAALPVQTRTEPAFR
jgi:Cu/Ag efflux pump CusA